MSIVRFSLENGHIYIHKWDDVENVSPRDYLLGQITQSKILKYLGSIERRFGECPSWLYKSLERFFSNRAIELLKILVLSTHSIHPFEKIINEELRKSKQINMLKDITLSPNQIFSILIYAGSHGYLLSHYSYKGTPSKGETMFAFKRANGEIVSSYTTMSDKELNYHIENDELTNAFLLCNGSKWFCFCLRKKGILGKEPGNHGGTPHIHFVSSAFNKSKDDIISTLKKGKLPCNSYHINLTEYF